MEYYIYNVPVFVVNDTEPTVDIPTFCEEVESYISRELMSNVEVVYIGNFKELNNRNAAFSNGGIYMTCTEPTTFDMVENFVHEVAHSLEALHGLEL